MVAERLEVVVPAPRSGERCTQQRQPYVHLPCHFGQERFADRPVAVRCFRQRHESARNVQTKAMMIRLFALEAQDALEEPLDFGPSRRHLLR